ncbi:MAG: hypothetical protein Q7S04_00435 [Candidatus Moranbacteria bacterium]|nr:hypothetical protein [Candidatus Moranbacteria bacterium]
MIFTPYKKYTTRIILFVLLLGMVGIIWYGIVPLKQAIYEKMRSIQEFYAMRENRQKQVVRLPELKAQYDVILQNEKLLDVLISENEIVNSVKTFEGIADETHVEMSITAKENGQITESKKIVAKADQPVKGDADVSSKNSAGKEKSTDILSDIPFDWYLYLNVRVRGRYEDVVVFLHKMETLPMGLDVIRLEMRRGEAADAVGSVSGSGINPFLLSSGDTQAEPSVAQKDVFEAVFDVLIYVDKKN